MITLILGGASCVWDDSRRFYEMLSASDLAVDTVIAVNDIGSVWRGPLHYWCSLHPEKLPAWMEERAKNGLETAFQTVSYREPNNTKWKPDIILPKDWGGSSGLLALRLAVDILKSDRNVLAGMPMDFQPHFFNPEPWEHFNSHRQAWVLRMEKFQGNTRSMSGWTKSRLEEPTPEWLKR